MGGGRVEPADDHELTIPNSRDNIAYTIFGSLASRTALKRAMVPARYRLFGMQRLVVIGAVIDRASSFPVRRRACMRRRES
jgi:hypothetical protein